MQEYRKTKYFFLSVIFFTIKFCVGQTLFGEPIKIQLQYSETFFVDNKDTIHLLVHNPINHDSNIDKGHDLLSINSFPLVLPKDIKDGRYICFYDTLNKRIAKKFQIKNGAYDGLLQEYYAHGTLSYTSFYFNGKRNGLDIIYYPNGMVNSIAQYKDGQESGFRISSFYNSMTAQISYYKNDSTSVVIENWGLVGEKPILTEKKKIKISK